MLIKLKEVKYDRALQICNWCLEHGFSNSISASDSVFKAEGPRHYDVKISTGDNRILMISCSIIKWGLYEPSGVTYYVFPIDECESITAEPEVRKIWEQE